MHWIFEKVNIKGYVLQNLISFYFFDQELSLGTKNHFASIKRKKKQTIQPPLLLASVAPLQLNRWC